MGRILVDQDLLTIDNTDYSDAKTYSFKTDNRFFRIREIALTWDTTFKDDGRYLLFINGDTAVSQGTPQNELSPLQDGFQLPLNDTLTVLDPGRKVEIPLRLSSAGTGAVNVQIVGEYLNEKEYEELLKARGLS